MKFPKKMILDIERAMQALDRENNSPIWLEAAATILEEAARKVRRAAATLKKTAP